MEDAKIQILQDSAETILDLLNEMENLKEEIELRKSIMKEHGCPLNSDLGSD